MPYRVCFARRLVRRRLVQPVIDIPDPDKIAESRSFANDQVGNYVKQVSGRSPSDVGTGLFTVFTAQHLAPTLQPMVLAIKLTGTYRTWKIDVQSET